MNGVNLCSNIIVSGWSGEYFARNIFACTPKLLIVLTDSTHQEKWQDVGDNTDTYLGKSILDINNGKQSTYQDIHRNKKSIRDTSSPADTAIKYKYSDDIKCSECIFLGLSEETEIKILARGSHVIVQDQEKTIDKRASNLVAGDKVILDLKSHQSSPAEQFTEAFIRTVESTNPQVVEDAKTWRLGLQKHLLERNLSMSDLRQELLKIGIERDVHTIQGWLDCERQSPIAPLHYRSELELMWNMIGQYTSKSLEDVIHACSFLRSLRHEASKALLDLLMGDAAKLSGENRDLEFLVYKLREDVQAHEIEFVSEGKVPSVMLGWWVNIDIIDQFLY